jgi:SAM-dependent methyltransferase
MFGRSLALPEFPSNHAQRGLGLTDSEDYATRLVDKFDYQNTYLHQEPRFDIEEAVSIEKMGTYDFLISSEVFEHVSPPVERVFLHSYQLLKPGGVLILTVPYGKIEKTIEHFPDLYDYSLDLVDDRYVLTNTTREGNTQKYDNLLFHGGPGSTLEMRVFAERDLLAHLTAAGFTDLHVHSEACFQSGIWWRQAWSLPISARRPA